MKLQIGLVALTIGIFVLATLTYLSLALKDIKAVQGGNVNTGDRIPGTTIGNDATLVREADAKISLNLVIDNKYSDPEHHCEFCTKMVYTPGPKKEAGVAYKDDNLDMGASQRIVFFAKGQPNEQVSFVAAGNTTNVLSKNDTDIFPRINFSVVTENVTLKNDWQRFEIGLNGTELSDATYPFGIQLAADSTQQQIFYIKGITLDSQPAKDPLPTVLPLDLKMYDTSQMN